jgi:DNA polymerase III delta prime subunit
MPKMSSARRLKKNAAPPPSSDDDSSVDSKGNLKGFIVYSDDENDKKKGKTKTARYNTRSKKETGKIEKRMTKMEIDDDDEPPKRPSRKSTIDETYRSPRLGAVTAPSAPAQQKKKKRRADTSSSSSSSTTSYSADSDEEEEFYGEGSEDDDEETYDSEEDSDYDEEEDERMPSIMIIGGGQEDDDRMVPKRHNMKKETEIVRKFVDLVTVPPDENTIDNQIDMFKGLTGEEQRKVIDVLENRASNPHILNPQESLMFKIMTMKLPAEIQGMVLNKYQSLQMLDPGSSEYFKNRAWLDKLTSLPLGYYKSLPVRIGDGSEACTAFMERAKRCLNDAIYGQEEAKLQILQYIAAKIANPEKKGTSLILAGPPGIGKTQLIKSGIAKAFDWPFQFISLGGDSDASTYTGHQLVYESSHCGKIVNSLISAKSMSMILMFDEVDKISATPKGEEVQHLLIHLTDPVQNELFEDKYLAGIPLDLGSVLYVFSANDIGRLDRILLDRMTVIQLAGYNAKEKLTIAEQFLLPNALDEVGLKDKVGISKEILQYIIEHYANEEPGVRELKRCMEQLAQKINMLRMFNSADLPFHVKDFKLPFIMKKEHIDLFLKRRENRDKPPMGMYI